MSGRGPDDSEDPSLVWYCFCRFDDVFFFIGGLAGGVGSIWILPVIKSSACMMGQSELPQPPALPIRLFTITGPGFIFMATGGCGSGGLAIRIYGACKESTGPSPIGDGPVKTLMKLLVSGDHLPLYLLPVRWRKRSAAFSSALLTLSLRAL